MASPVTFGEWLRQQRNERQLTREQFARRVGCSVAMLRKIEDGERRPSTQIAELIANCLNVPLAERSTFVRVARGELNVERLPPVSVPGGASIRTAAAPPLRSNLPVLPTPLIGRQREVGELSQLLGDPQCRLVTLVGPGGIGKTRLAIETASQVQDAFADGVYFVPLAPVTTTNLIVPVIADSVGFAFHHASHADPKTQLFSYLKEKQALLLVDNLEQLLTGPGVEVLAELLANAPQVRVVATSRASLELQYEWVFEVQGLPIPESYYEEGSAQNTSVELFVQRARRARVGFSATPEDYPAIVRICQLVAGLPLAIELAAAWVRTLPCDEIAREIERGLDFLSLSARDVPARHRSMRAVLEHSWKLLTEEEQRVLLRLAVFQSGFRRQAAEQVADAALSELSTLVMKSLLRRSSAGRYDLHELLRLFAADRLADRPEELSATQARHGRYYVTYFSQADARLRSAAQLEVLAELTAEMDNFRAAWDWAVNHGEFGLIEQAMRLFWWFYDTRGSFQEGLDTLDRAVIALEAFHEHSPPDRTDQVALGHLLATRAWFAYRLANYGQAQRMFERSLEIVRPLNEPRVLVEATTHLGMLMEVTGNYARALELYSEGVEIATAIGDRWYSAMCLACLNGSAAIVQGLGPPQDTHARLQSAVADCRLLGDPRLTAFGLRILSQSAFALGRYDEARAAMEESAALSSSAADGWGLGTAYRGLAVVAQAQGQHEQAVDMFHKSLDTFIELGGGWWEARVLAEMSRSLLALGNHTEAGRACRESLRIATDIHGTPVALEALAGFASLQAKQANMEYALELLLIVLNHPASFQETKIHASEVRAELEAGLAPTLIEAIQTRAAENTIEAVVEGLLR
jgi:predicted ATPase/transcriptional regulator with XRE-family HTH domain